MTQDKRIGKTVSHYKITARLGGGGMGIVYKAEDINLKRTVALKFLALNLITDEQTKTRFIYEARAASALDHPRIGTIYEIQETDDGEMFIAMAYYDGETLKDKISRGGISVDEAVKYLNQIANGLAAAHEQGIVHRDVKPANIIITKEGFIKIVDFGLAKLGDSTRITQAGTSMGTPAYMSPEQAKGVEADQRSDIWSLGVIFYELLTGQLPFKGYDEMSMMFNIVNEPLKPLHEANPGTPRRFQKIIDKALAKNPANRYASIHELITDLESGVNSRQIAVDDVNTIIVPGENKRDVKAKPIRGKAPADKPRKSRINVKAIGLAIFLLAIAVVVFMQLNKSREDNKSGYLKLTTQPPGAKILLNNQLISKKTPAIVGPLKASDYGIALTLDGFRIHNENLTIMRGDTISREIELIPAIQTGSFAIDSNPPGAAIYLDNKDTGQKTPATIEAVDAGQHKIMLQLPEHQDVTTTLIAKPGQTKEWIAVLTKTSGTAVVEIPQRRSKEAITKTQPASLFIQSEPQGAEIFINNQATGKTTPDRLEDIRPGFHKIRVALAGYVDNEMQVSVKAGEDKTVNLGLKEKERGEVRVTAVVLENNRETFTPANFTLNGKSYQTPQKVKLPEGEYLVEVKLFGYQTQQQKVKVIGGQTVVAKFVFEK